MEKINNKTSCKTVDKKKAEKGTVTVRKKGNSFEARIRLELKNIKKGVDINPRLSRSGMTEDIAKRRLAQLIVETYLVNRNINNIDTDVFSSNCEKNLKNFEEYNIAKEDFLLHSGISSCINFADFSVIWLNYKKDYINPANGKKVSPKTVETYAYTLKKHIIPNFSQYTVKEMTKEIIEDYITVVRKEYPRAAKDTFLMIRQILRYAKEKKLINDIPEFDLRFPKKKRSKKNKLVYLPAERQVVWLDILEKDGRNFCKLFSALLQTGMRPEEGCGLMLSDLLFDKDLIRVRNAHKDITIYDYNFNIIGHEYIDDDLKTEESYRDIPITPRLKNMFLQIYTERKELIEKEGKIFDPSKEYVFLNTLGKPYLPERLDIKLKSIIKKYNLEHMTVYGFRHSFATLMSENGMDKEVLREMMGHSDFETTDFYYIFISDKRKQEEFKRAYDKSFSETSNSENKQNNINKVVYKGKKIRRKKIKAPIHISA